MKTEETNKVIAEFMEHKPTFEVYIDDVLTTLERPVKNYNSDWNWLMEVVEKIENLSKEGETYMFSITKFSARVTYKGSRIVDLPIDNTKIEAVYNACVEFIKWYNEQNKT